MSLEARRVITGCCSRSSAVPVAVWPLRGTTRSPIASAAIRAVDRALSDIVNQRPNQISENIYKDKSKGPMTQYLNPAAFAPAAPGTLGNFGRVNVKAPPTWQFDAALSRIFRFRESQNLEFRLEAYNVTNSF